MRGRSAMFRVFRAAITKETTTMALDQSALTDMLEALRSVGTTTSCARRCNSCSMP